MYTLIRSIFRKWRKAHSSYSPLVEVRISRSALISNYEAFLGRTKQIAPVLKSNAYGHGLVEVARILDSRKELPFFVVDSYFEALTLRNEGIQSSILVIGYTKDTNILNDPIPNTAYTIHSLDQLESLSNARQPITIHLKVDTGMHRHGIMPEEIDQACEIIKNAPHITLEGIASHLSDADGTSTEYTEKQITIWNDAITKIKEQINTVRYFHLAQTAGSYETNKANTNVIRLGIGLYGYTFNPRDSIALKPALELHTVISSIKTLTQGESIGYNNTFIAPKDLRVATLPVGYFEGVDRRLSSKGSVLINGSQCPIIGRVSMNITSVDVSTLETVNRDDGVTVISRNITDPNSVSKIAKVCECTAYEVLIHIPSHLRRVIVS